MDCESGRCALLAHECREPLDTPDAGVCASAADCAAQTPICDDGDGACRGCEAGAAGDAECATRDSDAPRCASDGRCAACVDSAQCGATAPICDENDGVCRACEAGAGDAECAARDSGAPQCAGNGRCVACVADADCDSEGCDIDARTCIAAGEMIYVDNESGADTGSCPQDSPCATIRYGLTHVIAGRDIVKVRATGIPYAESLAINGLTVRIKGPGAHVVAPEIAANTPVLDIFLGADVAIEGLTIRGAHGDTDAHGIVCSAGNSGDPPTLRLVGVTLETNEDAGLQATRCTVTVRQSTISGNGRDGIEATRGELTVEQSTITGNGRIGVFATACILRVEQSTITGNGNLGIGAQGEPPVFSVVGATTVRQSTVEGNDDGGIGVVGGPFTIENNFIVGNVTSGSRGGVFFRDSDARDPQVFRFNTVADNQAPVDAFASGVYCDTLSAVAMTSNIIYGGLGGAPTVSGSCAHSYSNIQGGASGMENIDSDPLFVNPMVGGDYHLQAGSPCRNAADPAGGADEDIDGDARPQGGRSDMGADEVVE